MESNQTINQRSPVNPAQLHRETLRSMRRRVRDAARKWSVWARRASLPWLSNHGLCPRIMSADRGGFRRWIATDSGRLCFVCSPVTPRIRTLIATSRKIVTNYFIMEVNGRMGTIFCQKFYDVISCWKQFREWQERVQSVENSFLCSNKVFWTL